MKTKSLIIAYLTFLATFANATPTTPDHLEPLGLLNSDESALYNSLIRVDGRSLFLCMIKDYSLSSHIYAVVIDARVEYEVNEEVVKFKSMQCYLRCITTNPKLPFKQSNRYKLSELQGFERHEIPIEEEFANLMKDAWNSVLKQTRYADDEPRMVLDGTNYIFGSGGLYGTTLSPDPESGIPVMLIELADQLRLLVQADEKDRDRIHKICIEQAKLIIAKTNPNQRVDLTR